MGFSGLNAPGRGAPGERPAGRRPALLAQAGIRNWLAPLGDAAAERRRDGRLAAFLFAIAAIYDSTVLVELPGHRVALLVIVLAVALAAAVLAVVPWQHLPRQALAFPVLLAFALLSLATGAWLGELEHFAPLYGLALGYCGLVLGPGQTFEMTLAALLGLVIALLGNQDHDVAEIVGTIVVSGLLGELIATAVAVQRRHRTDLERLHEGVLGLLAAQDQSEAARLISHLAGDLLRADGVSVVIREHVSSPFMFSRGGFGLGAGLERVRVDINAEQSGVGVAARSGESLFLPDSLNSPLLDRRMSEALRAASVLYLPLIGQLEVLGVIVIWWSTPVTVLDGFAQQVVRLLSIQSTPVLERVRQLEDLDLAAVTDPLTGCGNRRAYERRLLELAPDAALVSCDLNRFKELNDTLGHPAGDQVLRLFAAAAGASVRSGDLVARIGGDEFAMIVDGGEAAARAVLARLRAAWAEPEGVGFSAGLAARRPGEDGAQLSERADQELYAAKRAGRSVRSQHA